MYTPVPNPNLPLSTNSNANTTPPLACVHVELGKILRKHDSNAIRLYDFINHVSVFHYNAAETRWENDSCIEGNLFVYKRQKTNSKQAYAFAIINEKRKLIQETSAIASEEANKLFLFYQVVINSKCEVFSLHFSNENECLRVHAFINQARRKDKEEQVRVVATSEQKKPQIRPPLPSASSHSIAERSTPIQNSNTGNDQTLSLKRLLNIPSEKSLDNREDNPLTLIPPSAFLTSPSSTTGAEHRDYFRDLLLHLVQTNDDFVNIIHRACHNYSSP